MKLEQYRKEPKEVKSLIEHLTVYNDWFDQQTVVFLCERVSEFWEIKSKLIKEIKSYLIETGKSWNGSYFRIEPSIALEALCDVCKRDEYLALKIKLKIAFNFYRFHHKKANIDSPASQQLICFLNNETIPKPIESSDDDDYSISLIAQTLGNDRFVDFTNHIHHSVLTKIAKNTIISRYYNLHTDLNTAYIVEHARKILTHQNPSLASELLNIELYLKGKFEEVKESLTDSYTDKYIQVALELLNNEHQSALENIFKLLSFHKKEFKEDLPSDPLLLIISVLTLSIAHKKRIDTTSIPKLLKKGSIKNSLFCFTIFSLVTGVDHEIIWKAILNNKDTETTEIQKLFVLVISKKYDFNGIEQLFQIDLELTECRLKSLQFNWLLWEFSPILKNKANRLNPLSEQQRYTPFTRQFEGIKDWELVLDTLLTIPELNKQTTKTTSNKRIAYLWEDNQDNKDDENRINEIEITPIQQSEKLSGRWSKGQAISLLRFADKKAEGMTPQDLEIASSCIISYSYGTPSFNMARTLRRMVGNPNILLHSNRDVRIELLEEKPQITIRKKKNKVEITANVETSDSLSILIRENDTRYKFIALNQHQRQIINQLLKIKFYPLESESKIKELLSRLSSLITIFSDINQENQNINTLDGCPQIVVQLLPIGESIKAELFVKPIAGSPPYLKAGIGVPQMYILHEGKKVNIKRNIELEKTNINTVSQTLNKIQNNSEQTDIYIFEEAEECLELFDALNDIQEKIIIEWPEGVKFKLLGRVVSENLNIRVSKANNWFEMEGELKIDEQYSLSLLELLKVVRSSSTRFIELKPGEFVALSKSLRRQLTELGNLVKEERKRMVLPLFAHSFMDEMEQTPINLTLDKKVEQLRNKIKDSQTKSFDIPRNLQAELRPYQEEGFQWLSRLSEWGAGACLADDMGLGKTIQTIAILLCKAQTGPSLVVAPASVQPNWEREINRFAPTLNILNINATVDRQKLINEANNNDICLVTYGVMQTESDLISQKKFAVAVLDEAHTIKNRETKASKAAMKINAAFRIALTGTPIQNHLGEIWNLFQFTNPALLGSREHFNERFVRPIVEQKDREQQNRLRKLISPFLLRRTKTSVLDELPPKTEIQYDIELSSEEITLYEIIRSNAEKTISENPDMNKIEALALISKLRRAACHIGLTNPEMGFNSSKTKVLVELTNELIENNHRALVFSQFTSHLALIKKALDQANINYLYLDGSVPIKERERLVQEFQNGETPLFLISLKAGSLGLNLTAADYVFHIDPWWNPAIENQASDRIHRIGQKRPVTIYRLVSKNTIEEKILRLHSFKKELADSLLEGTDAAQRLSNNEILELLKT